MKVWLMGLGVRQYQYQGLDGFGCGELSRAQNSDYHGGGAGGGDNYDQGGGYGDGENGSEGDGAVHDFSAPLLHEVLS